MCVNAANLFIPKNEKDFHAEYSGKERKPRFERFWLAPHEVKLQFYLDQFLANIKDMWCTPNPSYAMRLGSDCEYCSFKEHIEFDAKGLGEGALVSLSARFNTEDFDLVDDLGESDDYVQG